MKKARVIFMMAGVLVGAAAFSAAGAELELADVQESLAASLQTRAQNTDAALQALGENPAQDSIIQTLSQQAKAENDALAQLREQVSAAEQADAALQVCVANAYLSGVQMQADAAATDPAQFWQSWKDGARLREEAFAVLYSTDPSVATDQRVSGTGFWSQVAGAKTGPSGEMLLSTQGDGAQTYLAYFLQTFLQDKAGTGVDGDWGQGSITGFYKYEKSNALKPYLLPRWDAVGQLIKAGQLTQDEYASITQSIQTNFPDAASLITPYSYEELSRDAAAEPAVQSEAVTEAAEQSAAGTDTAGQSMAGLNAAQTNPAGTDAAAQTNAAGTDAAAQTNAAGTDAAAQTNAAGTDAAAQTNPAGTDAAAQTNAAGTDAAAQTNAAGTDTAAQAQGTAPANQG